MVPFFDQPGMNRAHQLRRLGWEIGFLLVITWVWVLWPFSDHVNAWNETFFSTEASRLTLLFISAFLLFICIELHRGKSWAWWGAYFGIFIPMCFIVSLSMQFMMGISMILLMNIIEVLFLTCPRFDFFAPRLTARLDEISHSLGLVWQEQLLWRLVQHAKAGHVGEAVKQYRQEKHVTWDQAEQAIKLCMMNELELKSQLIKEHVQSMTGFSGDQKAITMSGVVPV